MYKEIEKSKGLKFIEFYNENNFHVILSNYGASIYQIDMANERGNLETITLTPKSPFYFENDKYLGLTVGRVAGRIEKGECYIDNKIYKLTPNEKGNALHSSKCTLAYKFFDYTIEDSKTKTVVIFTKHVNDLEDEYPGNLDLKVSYILFKQKDEIKIEYNALSDKDTYLNLTNHSYFNLCGNLKDTILNHTLEINKELYSKERYDQIFLSLDPVTSEFDFRKMKRIGDDIESKAVQDVCLGYDHMFSDDKDVKLILKDPLSKRKLTITSDYKDVVIYTNNYKTRTVYINNVIDKKYLGIAIEPSRLSKSMVKGGLTQKARTLYKHYIDYKFEIEE